MVINPLPKVQLSGLLRENLVADGFDPDEFAKYFADWKALGAAGEYADPYFGKDGLYDRPLRSNKRVLWHVHLRPASDPVACAEWDRQHDLGTRKTSNAVLVYVFDPVNGYLLLHLIHEPNGHSFSSMATADSSQFMNQLADIAEEFIYFNTVGL